MLKRFSLESTGKDEHTHFGYIPNIIPCISSTWLISLYLSVELLHCMVLFIYFYHGIRPFVHWFCLAHTPSTKDNTLSHIQ